MYKTAGKFLETVMLDIPLLVIMHTCTRFPCNTKILSFFKIRGKNEDVCSISYSNSFKNFILFVALRCAGADP